MLGDGDDVAAGDLRDGDTAVGLVGRVQVDVVRPDTGRDGDLEVLGLGQTLRGEVAGVEGRGDDDLRVNQLLVKGRVLALLVGGGDEGVALALDPFPQTQFILDGTEKTGLLLGVFAALGEGSQYACTVTPTERKRTEKHTS